jgi:excisionase family DNA binding protein
MKLLNIKETAQWLGVTEGTLRVWICHKKVPYVKVGKLVKFDLKRIEQWISENSVEPHPVYKQNI